jgi:ADP-ribose pyrophosphatase YjhB (NUDIX family)
MTSTVLREVKEETGLDIIIEKQLKTYKIIKKPDKHRVIIYWQARYAAGKLTPSIFY